MNLPGFTANISLVPSYETYVSLLGFSISSFGKPRITPLVVNCFQTKKFSGWERECRTVCPPKPPDVVVAQAPPVSYRNDIFSCYTQCGLRPTMITCTNQLACAGGSPNIFECIDDKGNIVSEPESFAWVDTFDYCCHGGGNCADGCFDQQNGGRNGGKGGNGKSPA